MYHLMRHQGLRVKETSRANRRHSPIVGSMLGQRRRRWTNIDSAKGQCVVSEGEAIIVIQVASIKDRRIPLNTNLPDVASSLPLGPISTRNVGPDLFACEFYKTSQ